VNLNDLALELIARVAGTFFFLGCLEFPDARAFALTDHLRLFKLLEVFGIEKVITGFGCCYLNQACL